MTLIALSDTQPKRSITTDPPNGRLWKIIARWALLVSLGCGGTFWILSTFATNSSEDKRALSQDAEIEEVGDKVESLRAAHAGFSTSITQLQTDSVWVKGTLKAIADKQNIITAPMPTTDTEKTTP